MSDGSADIEVQLTQRIRDSLASALDHTGPDEFVKMAGTTTSVVRSLFDREYVPMTWVALACQLNKGRGETDVNKTSVTECIKGALIRVPEYPLTRPQNLPQSNRHGPRTAGEQKRQEQNRPTPFMDPKSGRLLGFGVNTITFLILGYFLGGFALNPVLGSPSCEGLSPCYGSVIGLFISAMGSLAYTYYYFTRRV